MLARIKALLRLFFREPWALWLGVLTPFFVLLLIALIFREGDFAARLTGYLMTLGGLAFVIYSMNETQRVFGRPTIPARIASWSHRVRDQFRAGRSAVIAVSGAAMGMGAGSATVTLGPANSSISARLAYVEREVKRLDASLGAVQSELRQSVEAVRQELARDAAQRESAHKLLSERVLAFATGSINQQVLGALWALFGQVFATFPRGTGKIACRVLHLS